MFARAGVKTRGEEKKGMSYNKPRKRSGDVVELSEEQLFLLIKIALSQCQEKVSSTMILNESDFEKLLAGILEEKLSGSDWSVHTQLRGYYHSSWGEERYKIPDIVLLKDGFEYNEEEKKYVNDNISVAFELKYVHKWGETEIEDIEGDFEKLKVMGKTYLYSVVLFDVYAPDDPSISDTGVYITSLKDAQRKLNNLCNSSCKGKMNQSVFCKAIELKISPEEHTNDRKQITNNI